ncbi:YdcF family protein, partial [Lactobacillus sp. S2-2]|uniref:YdcF family protein n=1 Tax=Lactobacillus sp. S2-2 TaxID=2692917 RepID=UPI001F2E6CB5
MKQYALDKGLPSSDLIAETESKTTFQNMLFSKKIIEKNHFALDNGIYVSSNYHIYRAGTYARKAGLKIDGLGAKTSRFFVPNAIIREYIAVLSNHRIFNLSIAGLILIISIITATVG